VALSARLIGIIIILILISVLFSPVQAASIELQEPHPDSIITGFDQEFSVKSVLNVNTSDGAVYFLRGVFYPKNTNKYCGYTWNGQSWFNGPYSTGDGWKNLPSVSVSSQSAETEILAKLDADDPDCNVSGEYSFKVQRYTEKGSAIFDDQNEINIQVILPIPTPTLIPTARPTPAVNSQTSPNLPASVTLSTVDKNTSKFLISSRDLSPSVSIIHKTGKTAQFMDSTAASAFTEETFSIPSSVAGAADKKFSGILAGIPLMAGIAAIFSSAYLSFIKLKKSSRS